MNNNSIVAIVPARGQSKGLKRKNICNLDGKPLIAYTIEAALLCPEISRCIVSTEDAEINKISIRLGAEVIERPLKLATDTAQNNLVIAHVLDELKKEKDYPDCFVLLQPTSPFRTAEHIQECIKLFHSTKSSCTISVSEIEHQPYKSLILKDGYLHPVFDEKLFKKRRQDMGKIYKPNGAIYLMCSNLFMEKKSFFVPPVTPFIMDQISSIDIDTDFDLKMAEFINSYKS